MRRAIHALVASAVLGLGITQAWAVELATEQVLRKGNGAEPQTLDPHKAEGVPSSNILRDLYEGLTGEAPNGDIIPGAAESWTISEDGTVYRFRLRESARWSNGDPVTAQDFVFGLRRSADPMTASKYAQILAPIQNAERVVSGELPVEELGVKALDELTVEIRLKAPTPYFLGLLNHSSTYPVHRPSIEAHGDKFSRPGNLVGNGAYVLSEWVVQSHIVLQRNPNYWDDANTTINTVYYYATEDQSSELKRYRAGELDYTYDVPVSQVAWIRDNLGDELEVSTYLGVYYFGFNVTKPPFKDNVKLRRALSMAIDRQVICDKIVKLGEQPAYGFVPPGITGYTSQVAEYADLDREARFEEARRLYREAGYSKENPLKVEIRYNTHENHKKVSLAVAAMWRAVLGVDYTLINEEWKVFLQTRKLKQDTEVFRAGWIGDYNDPYTFLELLHSKHGINDSGYNNPEYDALLAEIAVQTDMARRTQLMEQAERMLLADQPIMPIYYYVEKGLVKPYVDGFVPNIMDHHYTKNWRILAH
ncbi:MAG: peptide ABC transporter substrate-binding protein [Pseudomonadota bacterium]|nr:peptide ABC transporter substrate-binding protein [Pseudomonadota bacterium]